MPIVIKVLRPDGMTEETLRRFRREATVLRQLGAQPNPNPNLVRFYDQGVLRIAPPQSPPNDQIELSFTVMEYVHGVTLADVIREQGGRGSAPIELGGFCDKRRSPSRRCMRRTSPTAISSLRTCSSRQSKGPRWSR